MLTTETRCVCTDHQYKELRGLVNENFLVAANSGEALLTTDAGDLFSVYLEAIPEEYRQEYNCHACKDFFNRYGSIVTVLEDGTLRSVLWSGYSASSFFAPAIAALMEKVEGSRVSGAFVCSDSVAGQPVTGEWTHFYFDIPVTVRHNNRILTAGQRRAELKEDFLMLGNALREYPLPVINQAVTLLKQDTLYRSEKVLGVAEWFCALSASVSEVKNHRKRENLIWKAVVSAPKGFAHIRSSMIGTLLDDLVAGLPFDTVAARFAEKMHPLQYRRPQAPPSDGNIKQAEEAIAKLGVAGSLRRRFARLEEVDAIWRPKEEKSANTTEAGVFSHLKKKPIGSKKLLVGEAKPISWTKFLNTVLPDVAELFLRVPSVGSFVAVTTAEIEGSKVIHQWNNPFAYYMWNGGSRCTQWGLRSQEFVKVTAVTKHPCEWFGDKQLANTKPCVCMLLEGCKESVFDKGNALFPENLISELHPIRKTIEAYSKSAVISGANEATACGMYFCDGSEYMVIKALLTGNVEVLYKIDRWD